MIEHVRRIEAFNRHSSHERQHYLQRAEALLERAKTICRDNTPEEEVIWSPKSNTRSPVLRNWFNELRAHPSNTLEAAHARQIEQRLVEHERRLAAELRRIEGGAPVVRREGGVV